eukprot:CAMPEP_0180808914 /NCGR_PEP_ID=MMETSP1038_2-20121128/64053_1 /TAXON_ID=632150 /ORGANISM="Azadinium spinosum, Strain 3D9" /LENGTH=32 /DNA_ID= /DNA_START= /DNA_END= /DNA_ORIENTATION=
MGLVGKLLEHCEVALLKGGIHGTDLLLHASCS